MDEVIRDRFDTRTSIAALLLSNMMPMLDDAARKANVPLHDPQFSAHVADVAVTLADALLERLEK